VYLNPCNLPNLAFLACIKINKLRRMNSAYGFESHTRLQSVTLIAWTGGEVDPPVDYPF
jgi:hypothetical protein